jgi:uridine kinase
MGIEMKGQLRPFIVGVAGGSGSGKSYLAKQLITLPSELVRKEISLDWYYRSAQGLSPEEKSLRNYDHPESIDFELLKQQLLALASGDSIVAPQYCFKTHERLDSGLALEVPQLLVVEGILAFHDPEVRALMTERIFVEVDDEERLRRRIERDVAERGRTEEDVRRQCAATVLPMHKQFVAPSKEFATMVVSGEEDNTAVLQTLLEKIAGAPPAP